MGHTPYGYRIENGCAVIDEEAAGKIRRLYTNYLAGMSQAKAAIEAGIETYHSSAKRLMQTGTTLATSFTLPSSIRKPSIRQKRFVLNAPVGSAS